MPISKEQAFAALDQENDFPKITREQAFSFLEEEPKDLQFTPDTQKFRPLVQTIKETGKELFAKNVEEFGFGTKPFKAAGEFISPQEERIQFKRPQEVAQFTPDSTQFSPLIETLKEEFRASPEKFYEVAATLPAQILQFALAGGLGKALKLPKLIGAIAKATPGVSRGTLALAKTGPIGLEVAKGLSRVGPKAISTGGVFGFARGVGEELRKEDTTFMKSMTSGLKGAALDAGIFLAFELAGPLTRGIVKGRDIEKVKKAVASVPEATQFKSAEEAFDFFKNAGLSDEVSGTAARRIILSRQLKAAKQAEAAIQAAPQKAPFSEPLLIQGDVRAPQPIFSEPKPQGPVTLDATIPKPEITQSNLAQGVKMKPNLELEYRISKGEERIFEYVISKQKSLSEIVGQNVTREGLIQKFEALKKEGWNVGNDLNEFTQKIMEDAAAKKAGLRLSGRTYQTGTQTKIVTPAQINQIKAKKKLMEARMMDNPEREQAIVELTNSKGAPIQTERSLEKVLLSTAKDPGDVEKIIDAATPHQTSKAKLETAMEKFVEQEELKPRSGEVVVSGDGGKINVVKGDKDMHGFGNLFGSPSQVARVHQEFDPYYVAGREADLRIKKTYSQMYDFKKKYKKLGSKDRSVIQNVMRQESERGSRFNENELIMSGVTGKKREAYAEIRNMVAAVGEDMKKRGMAVRDPLTHDIRVFEGDYRLVYQGKTHSRYKSEKEAIEAAQKIVAINPDHQVLITRPIEIPESMYALKDLRKKEFFRELREELGEGQIKVTKEKIQAIEKPKGRFFGPSKKRVLNLDTYIKDPIEAAAQYYQAYTRKAALDDFNKAIGTAARGLDPAKKNLAHYAEKYASFMNGERVAFDEMLSNSGLSILGKDNRIRKELGSTILKFEAFSKLGYNATSPLINLSQTVFNTIPVLGTRWTSRGVYETLSMSLTKGKNAKTNAKVIEALGFDLPVNTMGSIDAIATGANRSVIHPLWAFSKSESINKAVAALGEYWRSVEKLGLSHEQALTNARKLVDRTQFNMSYSDLSPLMRSQASRILFQFKGFALKELEFLNGLSTKEKAKFLALNLGLTGVSTLPFVQDSPWVLRFKEENPKLSRGVFGLFGIDVGEQLNPLGNILPQRLSAEEFVGPSGGLAIKTGKALFGGPQEKRMLYREITPVFVRRIMDAADQWKTGLEKKPSTGEALRRVSKKEAVLTGIGIKTVDRSQFKTRERILNKEAQERTINRQIAIDKILRGKALEAEENALFESQKDLIQAARRKILRDQIPKEERIIRQTPKSRRQRAYELFGEP